MENIPHNVVLTQDFLEYLSQIQILGFYRKQPHLSLLACLRKLQRVPVEVENKSGEKQSKLVGQDPALQNARCGQE